MKKRIIGIALLSAFLLSLTALGNIMTAADGGKSMYLSDLEAERNADCLLYCKNTTEYGGTITVGGVQYNKGVLTHPGGGGPSILKYNIEGLGYETFYCIFGKDASAGTQVGGDGGIRGTHSRAQVYVDGVLAEDSGNLAYPETYYIAVSIAGAKELKLVTTDGGDGIYCDASSYADAQLIPAGGYVPPAPATEAETEPPEQDKRFADYETAYLSDMVIRRFDCHTHTVGLDANLNNEWLYIDMTCFEKGLCIHALPVKPGFVEMDIEGLGFNTLAAYLGVCYSEASDCSMGSIICRVYCDGELKYESPVIRAKENGKYTQPIPVTVDVSGAKLLRLEVDPTSDGYAGDMACWGNACLSKKTDFNEIMNAAGTEPDTTVESDIEPVTEAGTEDAAASVTDGTQHTETESLSGEAESAEPAQASGCRSCAAGIGGAAILTAAAAAAAAGKKKQEKPN